MPMIQDPSAIFITMMTIVGSVAWLSTQPKFKPFFKVIPAVLFFYFVPTLLTTLGITPAESPFYTWAKQYLMPMALFLLIITIDIPSIMRLGPKMLIVMFSGTVGVIVGGPIIMYLFRDYLPPEAWKGLAALSGSWIGGVGNFAAIVTSLDAPTDVVSPVVLVDTFVGFGWFAFILFLSAYQDVFNRWNKVDDSAMKDVKLRLSKFHQHVAHAPTLSETMMVLAVGFVGSYLLYQVGGHLLPTVGKTFTPGMWGIILIMAGGGLLSFTPMRRLDGIGATRLGNVALYLLLTTIGAQGDLRAVGAAPVYMLAGIIWIAIHATFILVATRLVRAPLFYAAAGSVANIGGTISCPIAAEAYQEHMAPAGLLLALLGTLLGTYGALISGFLMKWVQGS